MVAIVSILNADAADQVRDIVRLLEEKCGLPERSSSMIPCFVWQVAGSYEDHLLDPVLQRLARRVPAFTIHTTGIGIFTGETPLIHIPIVRTMHLDRTHLLLWDELSPFSHDLNLEFASAAWVPHISLAQVPISQENLLCALEHLLRRDFTREISVDNFAILDDPGGMNWELRQHWSLAQEPGSFTGTIR